MKLLRLNKTVRVRFNPYIITSNRLLLIKICVELFFSILLLSTWFSITILPVQLLLTIIFICFIWSVEKFFKSTFVSKVQSILYVRESLFDMLISLNLYEENDNVVINSATLHFDITSDNNVIITVPLFGNKFLKLLKHLEDYLIPTLGLPLISKQKFPDYVIYKLGHIEEIEQYVFNSHTLTKEFFEDIPSPIIKLSNTQQFSLKSNTNLGIYGRTGTGKTIALQWYLFNAIAKGCGTTDNTYLGIVDGKGADLYALGRLLQEELGEQIAVGSSPQMLAKLSRQFVEIMNERFEIIKRNSSLNADAYDLGMTPNFLFVDELASIRDSCGSSKQGKELWNEILQNLGLIARKGRQAGCHLLLATQDPNAENIPVELRLQISSVLYLSKTGIDRLKMAFSMCELDNVPTVSDRKGEALFYADGIGSVEPVITIVPFVDVKTKQEFLQVVRNILPNY
ncbi:TPA: cell division protein FtsK [Streptococcus equi subsp. zooepidemicus]|uniref:FtsK/SpoIIIE domain-containing protein n=1 Tax=Streptococcus equi TaxID=1336 RepID=UPI0005C2ECB4|nr:FtsK/SpoIIIE domain-containing protein [Streptococcus equi]KIS11605.1 FtsK protein [Streptococcus equi subsp. zooepidemicus SzAM60]HEL0639752.1 cell division protein FtsK [Streptococcus equi subsp. zooepidemicus]HEL1179372.1 cell division protein FtsK [Streptococcus equi subsp. zooepidemicus]HEL1235055.1 cell division protein FtsK [Streptococcus equi subsp. zooepidemicus]